MNDRLSPPMREFLTWVAFRPRTHADAMSAWSSHCPRFTLWEDALDAGLITLEPTSGPPAASAVRLTPHGQAALQQSDENRTRAWCPRTMLVQREPADAGHRHPGLAAPPPRRVGA
jgi:hypothetical protein